MKRLFIIALTALLSSGGIAAAQQPQFTLVEQRLAMCTVEATRLQQQLTEALQKVAALEKAAKPPAPAAKDGASPSVPDSTSLPPHRSK